MCLVVSYYMLLPLLPSSFWQRLLRPFRRGDHINFTGTRSHHLLLRIFSWQPHHSLPIPHREMVQQVKSWDVLARICKVNIPFATFDNNIQYTYQNIKSRISYILIFLETKCELAIQNHHPCPIQDALSPRERIERHEAMLNCESSTALGDCPEPNWAVWEFVSRNLFLRSIITKLNMVDEFLVGSRKELCNPLKLY